METFLRAPRQREPISMVFREGAERGEGGRSIGSARTFRFIVRFTGAVLEQPSLPPPGKFGPRDVASRFLVSILEDRACYRRCLPGSHRLKVRIVVRLDLASKISLPLFSLSLFLLLFFSFSLSLSLPLSLSLSFPSVAHGIMEKLDGKLAGKRSKEI
jgi:hypothetical protein